MKKFISKNSNYRIILKHGVPAEPMTGRSAVPAVWVKFQNGIAVVNDNALCDLMLQHPGFGRDFILSEDNGSDPYAKTRSDIEPEHNITNIEYGHVGVNLNPKPRFVLPKDKQIELENYIAEEAKKLATKMAPTLAKELLKNLAEATKGKTTAKKTETKESDKTE